MRALLVALMLFAQPLFAADLPPVPEASSVNLVTEGEVHRVVEGFLQQRGTGLNAQLSVKRIGFKGDLKLPPGRVSFEVIAPDLWPGYGRASLALIVRVDDQVKRNLTVQVEVEALAEMVVASRTLERGEVLAPSDLALVRRDLSQVQGRYLKSVDEAAGLRARNVIRANTALRPDYLERVPVVKSGQLVTIVAENDVLRITASGKAKGSGAIGDSIVVQNLASLKEVTARVLDAATVKVDF
jgi:flagellar basal body P-ring formation protein FlgA